MNIFPNKNIEVKRVRRTNVMGFALAMLAFFVVSSQASARDTLTTLEGIIASGSDDTAEFGSDSLLTGKPFSLEFRSEPFLYDPLGTIWAIRAAKLTISGQTQHFLPLYYSDGYVGALIDSPSVLVLGVGQYHDDFGQDNRFVNVIIDTGSQPLDVSRALPTTPIFNSLYAEFVIEKAVFGIGTPNDPRPFRVVQSAVGVLNVQTIRVAFVPEPASWAMLIAGFGLTGAAMRRRRVAVAA